MLVDAAVDEAVEHAGGDEAQVERRRAERAELRPAGRRRRRGRDADDRLAEHGAPGRAQRPRRRATPHRHARPTTLAPDAWLTTSATAGPSSSTTHIDVANHGTPRLQFVEPSSGSITTVGRAGDRRSPLSSDSTPTPARREHVERGRVGHEVERVLAVALPDGPQSDDGAQRAGDGVGDVVQQARASPSTPRADGSVAAVAVIDVAGFVADLKSHAIDHGFHVHDERHFVETYSLRQLWEVDLHPEEACSGPIDLHLSLEVDPRALLGFEDEVIKLDDADADPPEGFNFPLLFTWTLPPLPHPPDLLVLATELAGVGGIDLPLEVSAIDSFASVTDAPERSLSIVSRIPVELAEVYVGDEEAFCATLVEVQGRQPVPPRARRRLARRATTDRRDARLTFGPPCASAN